MNDLIALRAKHAENVANLEVAKISLANVSHQLARAKLELELAKDTPVVSDVQECDECDVFKSDLTLLQSKYASTVCELEELKSRPVLFGACKLCPTLRSELEEKNALIKSLEKTKVVESSPPTVDCLACLGLIADMDALAVEKANLENENTYLREILSWVSCREPQLGMMIKHFKRGDGFGVGYAYTQSDFDMLYGKIGKAAGVASALNVASSSTQPSLVDPVEGVLKEPPKAPPQKQVWVPKPNELRNPLDTLPGTSAQVAQKKGKGAAPHNMVNNHHPKAVPPPKREARYHCEYCHRDCHLEEFCFRRKRAERRER